MPRVPVTEPAPTGWSGLTIGIGIGIARAEVHVRGHGDAAS